MRTRAKLWKLTILKVCDKVYLKELKSQREKNTENSINFRTIGEVKFRSTTEVVGLNSKGVMNATFLEK
jgi:hypothetical protein